VSRLLCALLPPNPAMNGSLTCVRGVARPVVHSPHTYSQPPRIYFLPSSSTIQQSAFKFQRPSPVYDMSDFIAFSTPDQAYQMPSTPFGMTNVQQRLSQVTLGKPFHTPPSATPRPWNANEDKVRLSYASILGWSNMNSSPSSSP
jgi:hypothetical protein